MNNQQAFDTVCAHLRKQGCRSMSKGGKACAYRGTDGRMCAVGVLIPDNVYDPEMDRGAGLSIDRCVDTLPKVAASLRGLSRGLLINLQTTHDTCRVYRGKFVAYELERSLKLVAEGYGLSYTPPGAAT